VTRGLAIIAALLTAVGAAAETSTKSTAASTAHLSFEATAFPLEVSPGNTISIAIHVTPKPRMHVYAPGSSKYRAIAVRVDPNAPVKVREIAYPKPESYLFEALNEEVLVYSEPFQLGVDVTIGDTPKRQAQLRRRSAFTLKGTLEYQACDDRICYLPTAVPIEWPLKIKR